jgi:hypothetical protein
MRLLGATLKALDAGKTRYVVTGPSRGRALPNSFMAINSSASQQPVWLVHASRPWLTALWAAMGLSPYLCTRRDAHVPFEIR